MREFRIDARVWPSENRLHIGIVLMSYQINCALRSRFAGRHGTHQCGKKLQLRHQFVDIDENVDCVHDSICDSVRVMMCATANEVQAVVVSRRAASTFDFQSRA